MENQKEVEQITAPVSIPVAAPIKKENYYHRIEKMTNRALKLETIRQGREDMRKSNYHGVILASVLDIVMDGFIAGKELYPR